MNRRPSLTMIYVLEHVQKHNTPGPWQWRTVDACVRRGLMKRLKGNGGYQFVDTYLLTASGRRAIREDHQRRGY